MSKVEAGQRTPDIVFGLDHLPYLLDQTPWCFLNFHRFGHDFYSLERCLLVMLFSLLLSAAFKQGRRLIE